MPDEDMTLEQKLVLAVVQFSDERGTAYEIFRLPFGNNPAEYVLQFAVNDPDEPTCDPHSPWPLFKCAVHFKNGEMRSQRGAIQIKDRELYNHFLVFLKSYAGIELKE